MTLENSCSLAKSPWRQCLRTALRPSAFVPRISVHIPERHAAESTFRRVPNEHRTWERECALAEIVCGIKAHALLPDLGADSVFAPATASHVLRDPLVGSLVGPYPETSAEVLVCIERRVRRECLAPV
jgi:hypothetical protein